MKTENVYTLLQNYFEQRSRNISNTTSLKRELGNLGKTPDEIYEILIEFDDDWDRELIHRHEVKHAKLYFIGGLAIAVLIGSVCILSTLNLIPNHGVTYIWYSGVAAGFLLAIKGWNGNKTQKIRQERLKLKYENW
jgi:hypothetical protein